MAWLLLVCAGAIAFLVVNTLMYLSQCTSTEFVLNCSDGNGTFAGTVVAVFAVLGIGAVISRYFRSFASGFAGMLVAMTVVSLGSCTATWGDPYFAWRKATKPARDRAAREKKDADAVRLWVSVMSGRPMNVSRGIGLVGNVATCAQSFARASGHLATDAAELSAKCPELKEYGAHLDPGLPRRYVIPEGAGSPVLGEPTRETDGDAGWRVTYSTAAQGFSVDAAPDAQLSQPWPRIHSDGVTRFDVQMTQNAAPLSMQLGAELGTMIECLKGIPAKEERRRAARGLGSWNLTPMARALCPSLAPRIKRMLQAEDFATLLDIERPVGPGGSRARIGTYRIEYVPRNPSGTPFEFDLKADPVAIVGLPRYLATFEGQIYWTMEQRAATVNDPRLSPRNP